MRRGFLTVGTRQVHYRYAGEGPPLVMLHPSPLSSAAVLPVAAEIARRFRVYALDTPGYGLSDPPAHRPDSLDDYLPLLAGALDALGLPRVCLYGAATGAQIAIEFAKRHPERVSLLVLDVAGHIPEDECERIVRDYFPSVTPQRDGRHLVTLWQMVRDLFIFFPWCDTRLAARVERDLPPPAVMQGMLLDYLRAGERYDWAYRPAFHNERAERARAVTVPAVLTRWEGSIALRITDALIATGLPPNFQVLPLGPTLAERCTGIAAHLAKHHRDEPAPPPPEQAVPGGRLSSRLIDLPGGQLHARVALDGTQRPVLLLHSAAASAAMVEPIAAGWLGRRPVVALDLPGSGESDPVLPAEEFAIERLAELAHAALDALGIDECDVVGRYSGGDVGLEMSLQRPGRIRRLAVFGVPLFTPEELDALRARYAPSFAPEPDGTHLLRAWSMMRDEALWFPWFRTTRDAILRSDPNLDPRFIHQRVVDVMKMGELYRAAYAAQFRYPLAERLGRTGAALLLAHAAWDPLAHKTAIAHALVPHARRLELPARFGEWAAALDSAWSPA